MSSWINRSVVGRPSPASRSSAWRRASPKVPPSMTIVASSRSHRADAVPCSRTTIRASGRALRIDAITVSRRTGSPPDRTTPTRREPGGVSNGADAGSGSAARIRSTSASASRSDARNRCQPRGAGTTRPTTGMRVARSSASAGRIDPADARARRARLARPTAARTSRPPRTAAASARARSRSSRRRASVARRSSSAAISSSSSCSPARPSSGGVPGPACPPGFVTRGRGEWARSGRSASAHYRRRLPGAGAANARRGPRIGPGSTPVAPCYARANGNFRAGPDGPGGGSAEGVRPSRRRLPRDLDPPAPDRLPGPRRAQEEGLRHAPRQPLVGPRPAAPDGRVRDPRVVIFRPTPAFPLFIFAAILPWKWFASGVDDAITSVTSQERIIKQVQFPKIVLPVSATVGGVVNFAFGLVPLSGDGLLLPGSHQPASCSSP